MPQTKTIHESNFMLLKFKTNNLYFVSKKKCVLPKSIFLTLMKSPSIFFVVVKNSHKLLFILMKLKSHSDIH